MKKFITVLVLALAVSLAFTGCASKKANSSKGPKIFRVDLGDAMSTIEIGAEKKAINVTSLLPQGAKPAAGDKVRVMWSFEADEDIDAIYVSCGELSDEYVLVEDVEAGKPVYAVVNVPLELDATDPLYVDVWSDTEAICELAYIDPK